MKIAIDITGGDHPQAFLQAAKDFAHNYPDIELVLLGLAQDKQDFEKNITFIEVSEIIEVCEEPTSALRKKKDSALYKGASLVKNNEVDCFISSGSSGAIISAGVLIVKRLAHIKRPCFPVFLENKKTNTPRIYLDVGASIDANSENIYNYAKLGKIYLELMHNIKDPKIRLLNVGSEASKGNAIYKEAYQLLAQDPQLNFQGNIEGYDLLTTDDDIIVMDGFVGNVMLKTLEGSFTMFNTRLKEILFKNIFTKLAALIIKPGLKELKNDLNPHKTPCTPILGINGLIIKVHGSAHQQEYYNALEASIKLIDSQLIEKMRAYGL